jgi:hypothetical protein
VLCAKAVELELAGDIGGEDRAGDNREGERGILAMPIIGDILKRYVPRVDVMPPLVRGAGLSPLPRPERLYFGFGTPIDTHPYKDRADDPEAHMELREQVRHAVAEGIERLLAERQRDPDRNALTRLLAGGSR